MINKNKLKGRMISSGYTIQTFADEIDLSRQTVGNIVSGRSQPSFSAIKQISQTLQLTSDELIDIFFPDYWAKKQRQR